MSISHVSTSIYPGRYDAHRAVNPSYQNSANTPLVVSLQEHDSGRAMNQRQVIIIPTARPISRERVQINKVCVASTVWVIFLVGMGVFFLAMSSQTSDEDSKRKLRVMGVGFLITAVISGTCYLRRRQYL